VRNSLAVCFLLCLLLVPNPARADFGTTPDSPDTVRVDRWLVVGPFPLGSREAFIDPIWPRDPANLSPSPGDSLASMMAPGGWVHWIPVEGKKGTVVFEYKETDWEGLSDQWGVAGTLCAGLASGSFETKRPGSFWIDANGVSTLFIDGRRYLGSVYGGSSFRAPIRLMRGHHTVLLRVSGGGPREVGFQLIQAGGPLGLGEADVTLPDLVAGERLDGWGAAPIINLTGREVRGAVLSFGDGRWIARVAVPIPPLPPEGILKVPFPVRTMRSPEPGEAWHGQIRLSLGSHAEEAPPGAPDPLDATLDVGECAFPCSLRVRGPHASRLMTFLSSWDGSVQKYAVLPPAGAGSIRNGNGGRDAAGSLGLILSLHGAGVSPLPQVESYAPKDWAYVVAPTNTRPYGFDWQDWGRMSAIETLDDALRRFPIDPDRVVLVGHSMGGHGTWHVGLAHTDRFAALAPSAGWASFGTYMPFTLRRDVTAADPELRTIWERAMAPDNALAFLRNAWGMPVFVLHGGADDNVPVFHGRLLSQRAREDGARVTYREIPGMGHWWDRPETPGVDCVDDPEMMSFLRTKRRVEFPDTVTLCTADLGTCNRAHWVTVDEALHPFDRIEVEACLVRHPEPGYAVRTFGVKEITLDPAGRMGRGSVTITIDSQRLRADAGGPIHLRLDGKRWRMIDRTGIDPRQRAGAARTPSRFDWGRGTAGRHRGPLKAAFFEPFVLVYGTGGTSRATEAMRRLALLDSQSWYLRADGYAPVLPDTAVTQEILATRNLILYAVPGSNAVLETMAARLPIRISTAGIEIGRKKYAGAGLSARFVSPNPFHPDRLVEVVAGTDLEGCELAASANPCYSGSGFPDFVVYDATVRQRGWGGMRAAGFFDAEGRVANDGRDAYFR
jgi:predicted esterase